MDEKSYLHKFDTVEEKLDHEGGHTYTEPYVSWTVETEEVSYNRSGVEITFNVTLSPNEEGLIEFPFWRGTTATNYPFDKILVDGKDLYNLEDLEPKTTIFFESQGYHTIKYFLTDKTFFGNTNGQSLFHDVAAASIVSIKLPDTLQEIGSYALNNCQYLETLYIPEGVTTIGNYAFYNGVRLREVHFPSTLKTIGNYAFQFLGIMNGGRYPIDIVLPKTITFIGEYCFSTSGIETISLGESLEEIKGFTFFQNSYLTRINIPASVTKIGDQAFLGCTNLVTIDFHEGSELKEIGQNAFAGSKPKNFIIPEGVTTLSNAVLSGAVLDNLVIPDSVTTVNGNYPFQQCSVKNVVLGSGFPVERSSLNLQSAENVEYRGNTIPNNFLYRNFGSSVKNLKLTGSPTAVGNGAFSFYQGEFLDLPESITTMGSNAFEWCSKLKMLKLPSHVTEIKNTCFFYCSSLTHIDLPENLTTIGNNVFNNCSKLEELTFPSSLISIGSYTSFPPNMRKLNLPDDCNIQHIGEGGLEYTPWYRSIISEKYIGKVLIKPTLDLKGRYIVKEGTTEIYARAFLGLTQLTYVSIPETVTSIGSEAFAGCTYLSSIICSATTAPTVNFGAFGSGSSSTLYTGYYSKQQAGGNKLYIPIGATGYDGFYWKTVLTDETLGGFQVING